jgi:hypothetical protein
VASPTAITAECNRCVPERRVPQFVLKQRLRAVGQTDSQQAEPGQAVTATHRSSEWGSVFCEPVAHGVVRVRVGLLVRVGHLGQTIERAVLVGVDAIQVLHLDAVARGARCVGEARDSCRAGPDVDDALETTSMVVRVVRADTVREVSVCEVSRLLCALRDPPAVATLDAPLAEVFQQYQAVPEIDAAVGVQIEAVAVSWPARVAAQPDGHRYCV